MLYITTIFTLYVVFILLRFKGIESISKSFYLLKRYGFLFSLWLSCISIMLVYHHLDKSLVVIASCGLFYTAIVPTFKNYITDGLHYVGNVIAILSGISWMLMNGLYYYTILYLITLVLLYWYSKRPLLWGEVISFYTFIFALYMSNL